MIIYIIGAGAIGKALAVFLKGENKDVLLVRGSVDNQPEIYNKISVSNQNGQIFEQEILTTTLSNLDSINGIVLICTKSYSNGEIAEKLKKKNGVFSIVLLQNGLNIEEAFSEFKELYRCVLFSGSQIVNGNNISYKAIAKSPIGKVGNDTTGIEKIINTISTEQFGFRSEENIGKHVWDKVIINCAFNSICPLLETDNGIFHRNKTAINLAREIIKECVELARAFGINLDKVEIEEKLLFLSQKSEGQLISTYEDIRKKRRTEIESLNLEIARLADKIGKPHITIKTKLLGKIISIKSDINREK